MTTFSPNLYTGTEAARAASTVVPAKGDVVVTDEGFVYYGDGVTQARNLSHGLKANELGIPNVVAGVLSLDITASPFWRRTNGTIYRSTPTTPETGSDVQVAATLTETGALRPVRPGDSSTSPLDRIITLENAQPTSPVISVIAGAWPASTAVPASTLYRLPTGGLGYVTAARTTRATFDATERGLWTFLPGGHYEKFTVNGNWVCPSGVTQALVGLTGAGGGGGGGGTPSTSIAQTGGGGGGAGAHQRYEISGFTVGTSYAFVLGIAGASGAGGASGGNPGTAGGNATATTFQGPGGTTYNGAGGGGGAPSLASSVAAVSGGTIGLALTTATALIPGCGGTATTGTGNAALPGPSTIGGGGGGHATTAPLGGLGGNARVLPGGAATLQSGASATTAGGNGVTPTELGCGGGGGGAGGNGGAGGAGGAGSAGVGEVWF